MARTEAGRGRSADRPRDIPKPGWRDILWRTWTEMGNDHVSIVAAGVAFFGLLAIFPAITALISMWGLALDPQSIEQQLEQIVTMLPQEAASIITDQARQIAAGAGTVTFAAIGGLLLALYSATAGMKSLIEGLNIIYDEEEKRSFIRMNLVAFALTLGLLVVMIVTMGLIIALPVVFAAFGLGSTMETLLSWLRWPLMFVVAMVSLSVLYRFGPSRRKPEWRWVSWGAAVATLLWVVASAVFSFYVSNFASYNETYGTLGAGIVLLMWLWISAFVVLMGAELNSEIEHQTARDSTVGGRQSMGQRGAHAADTVGRKP